MPELITKAVAIPKGTTHLVSDKDFNAIVEYQEPGLPEGVIEYMVGYVLATKDGKDLVVRRSFATLKAKNDFITYLGTKNGVKVVQNG